MSVIYIITVWTENEGSLDVLDVRLQETKMRHIKATLQVEDYGRRIIRGYNLGMTAVIVCNEMNLVTRKENFN